MSAVIALAVLVAAGPAPAQQDYPSGIVTIIAPAAPGGLYSMFARLIGSKLEQRFGRTFIVENRPGAGSIVGMVSLLRSVPNGYTLLVANSTGMATNVTLHKNLPYDPIADFAPIALIARIPEVLVVNAALPVRSIADLVKLAKATPGGLSFSSAGAGTSQHLDGELLKSRLEIEMTHIPYKGMSPAINDVVGGHVQMMFSPIPIALPFIRAGKLRPLGVTTAQRVEAIPEVPPLTEIGVKDFDSTSWFMLVAPAKTPKEIIDRLHAELRGITGDAGIQQEFVRLGLVPVNSPPPEDLRRFVQSEIVRWGDIARKAGLAESE